MPRARLIFRSKRLFDDGAVVEMRLWRVPRPVPGSQHGFKYSLFYGSHGRRLVGYDTAAGKGDHRHYGEHEHPYVFTTPEALVADVRAMRRS